MLVVASNFTSALHVAPLITHFSTTFSEVLQHSTFSHLCQTRVRWSRTAATSSAAEDVRGKRRAVQADRQRQPGGDAFISKSDPPRRTTSPLTFYLFATSAGGWCISRRLWLIGSDCAGSSITSEIGNTCGSTSECMWSRWQVSLQRQAFQVERWTRRTFEKVEGDVEKKENDQKQEMRENF